MSSPKTTRPMSVSSVHLALRFISRSTTGSSHSARRNERRAPCCERSKNPAKAASNRARRSRPSSAISISAKLIMRGKSGAFRLLDPVDDMIFEVARRALRDGAAADRDARLVHGLGIARDQRMPPIQVATLRHQPVAAGLRQPVEAADVAGGELHAIRHDFLAVLVILAAAVAEVELLAGDIGEK